MSLKYTQQVEEDWQNWLLANPDKQGMGKLFILDEQLKIYKNCCLGGLSILCGVEPTQEYNDMVDYLGSTFNNDVLPEPLALEYINYNGSRIIESDPNVKFDPNDYTTDELKLLEDNNEADITKASSIRLSVLNDSGIKFITIAKLIKKYIRTID